MKFTTITFICFFLAFSACEVTNFNIGYFIECKVDEIGFLSKDDPVLSADSDISSFFTIVAINKDGIKITLQFDGSLRVGEFEIGTGHTSAIYEIDPEIDIWKANASMGSGTLNITSINDTYITGIFSFTAVNEFDESEKIVSDGMFTIEKNN